MKLLSLLSLVLVGLSVSSAGAADAPVRRAMPSETTPSAPAAAGPLRILLVDDDASYNNHSPGDTRLSPSDRIFRQLVSDAVAGDAAAWAIEAVKPYASGPDVDRLRKFSMIVWYTGASYGGNPDNSAVLSIADEKSVRRYLEETGGVVILVSPGYVSKVLGSNDTWEKASWPFLSDVLGLRGGRGLAQRFEAGTVKAADGAQFKVGKGDAAVETQFSAVNPNGAAVLFTASLNAAKRADPPSPVATVHSYGRGRIAYVGFTFENLATQDLAPAFRHLVTAAGLQTPAASGSPVRMRRVTPTAQEVTPATVEVSGTPTTAVVRWTLPRAAIVQNVTLGSATPVARRASNAPPARVPLTKVERLDPNWIPLGLAISPPDALEASDPGPLTPGHPVTYRVTLTDSSGVTVVKETTFTPPLPKDPEGLRAQVQLDGSIILSWLEVPGVLTYQISADSGLSQPVMVRKATEWRSPRLDARARRWTVNSVYEPGGTLTASDNWPSTISQGTTRPTARVQFLSLPNGTGSSSESEAHYRAQCATPGKDLDECLKLSDLLTAFTNWFLVWGQEVSREPTTPEWSIAAFADMNDLALGRRVNCVPRKGGVTVCWATSHGDIPSPGAILDGPAMARAAEQVVHVKSLNLIMISPGGAFFGTWEAPPSPRLPGTTTPFDEEFNFAKTAKVVFGTALDSQGRKSVPHACLSCHGGRYDASRKLVVGASLLPLVPSHLTFSSATARTRAEEEIRRINQIVLESNPSPMIRAQITAMYNGSPTTPGTRAGDAAVPPGWSSQPGLYRQVIAPYCGSCHFAQAGPLGFATFRNLQDNKQRVQRAVCTEFSMPHSEQGLRRFWSEGGPVSLPGMLSTALGFPECRK